MFYLDWKSTEGIKNIELSDIQMKIEDSCYGLVSVTRDFTFIFLYIDFRQVCPRFLTPVI